MRKIKIDSDLLKKAITFRDQMFVRSDKKMAKPKIRLENLRGKLGKIKHKKHREYLQLLMVDSTS